MEQSGASHNARTAFNGEPSSHCRVNPCSPGGMPRSVFFRLIRSSSCDISCGVCIDVITVVTWSKAGRAITRELPSFQSAVTNGSRHADPAAQSKVRHSTAAYGIHIFLIIICCVSCALMLGTRWLESRRGKPLPEHEKTPEYTMFM